MKIITLNVNGIRSCAKKGFFEWVKKQNADVICLQETRAHLELLANPEFQLEGYQAYFSCAEKLGYSGVGIYTRHKPKNISCQLGWSHADKEGRYLQIDFPHLSIASLYMPSGTSGDERQSIKFDFLHRYEKYLEAIAKEKHPYIICGDWNIAHKPIDLKNWKANQKHSGFLPEERAWLDKLFGSSHFYDAFRLVNQDAEQYTWWSNRGRAWEKNVGWRIDYQVITAGLKDKVKSAAIYKDQRFSDHAPLVMEYGVEL